MRLLSPLRSRHLKTFVNKPPCVGILHWLILANPSQYISHATFYFFFFLFFLSFFEVNGSGKRRSIWLLLTEIRSTITGSIRLLRPSDSNNCIPSSFELFNARKRTTHGDRGSATIITNQVNSNGSHQIRQVNTGIIMSNIYKYSQNQGTTLTET